MSAPFSRPGVMLSAYAYAVVTASCVPVICISLVFAIALPFDMAARDGTGVMEGIFVGAFLFAMGCAIGLVMGSVITLVCAFPGWLICVLIAELSGIKRRVYYLVASVPTVLMALYIYQNELLRTSLADSSLANLMAPKILVAILITTTSLIGGLVGAHFYWKRAGQDALPNFERWKAEL
jgi:hypothetical protein